MVPREIGVGTGVQREHGKRCEYHEKEYLGSPQSASRREPPLHVPMTLSRHIRRLDCEYACAFIRGRHVGSRWHSRPGACIASSAECILTAHAFLYSCPPVMHP